MTRPAAPARPPVVGVCSWSLQPASPEDLAAKAAACGVAAVQLALDPLRTGAWDADRTVAVLGRAGIQIRSGMIGTKGEDYSTLESIKRTGGVRPDEHWPENLAAARASAALAATLGLTLVTFHAGFIPHDPADPLRPVLVERLRTLADVFAARGITLGFETGQESAETLLDALRAIDHPSIGVNFDPANMILYGMGDPIDALRRLAPRVVQIHIKDARPTATPGQWGRETPAGEGAVDWPAFFRVVRETGLAVDFMIEREAGGTRTSDIVKARTLVASLAS